MSRRSSVAVVSRFELGQAVSTIRRVGSTTDRRALWDVCCTGRVAEIDTRDGHSYYRLDVERVHWHAEYEVHAGDAATFAACRLNTAALNPSATAS